jgi:hypothetical protein
MQVLRRARRRRDGGACCRTGRVGRTSGGVCYKKAEPSMSRKIAPRTALAAAALLFAVFAVLPPALAPGGDAFAFLDDGDRGQACHGWIAILPPRPSIEAISDLSPPLRRAAVYSRELAESDEPIPSRAPPRV